MSKYLYGAAVQGIQGFIFQTNKLREIVGASELVEEICTTLLARIIYEEPDLAYKQAKERLKEDPNAILFAAGNVKYIFDTKEQCERLVRVFPKAVSEFAPGVSASQAVVQFDGQSFKDAVNKLESHLRSQRNKPMRSQTIGLMGVQRSRQTGLPVVAQEEEGALDAATFAKLYECDKNGGAPRKKTSWALCQKAFLRDPNGETNIKEENIAFDIKNITEQNDWIAIIHADGNGLGQIVQKIGTDQDKFRAFSQKLDESTVSAAVDAFEEVIKKAGWDKFIPIRPIVLGGDDLTVVCRGDLALDYVTKFIESFEKNTKNLLSEYIEGIFTEGDITDSLTACAGIAYIKSSYPFYYGYSLAESLCSRAKKYAKDDDSIREGRKLPLSCIMFHKVQSSFVEEYDEIVGKELTPQDDISFEFGPYFIKENGSDWTVDNLNDKVKQLSNGKEGNAVKSHLRNWMGLLYDNKDMAGQKLKRLRSMTSMDKYVDDVTKGIKRGTKTIYPVYDILAIHTINTQKTKNKNTKDTKDNE